MGKMEEHEQQNEENTQNYTNSPIKTSSYDELTCLADDYAKYVSLDVSKERTLFDDNIEDLLTRLDEYCSLIDIVRSDTNLCLAKTLPAIREKSRQMETVFQKIDQLEAFVSMVKGQVSSMEEQIVVAEEHMGSLSTFKKMFSSFQLPSIFVKRQTPSPHPSVKAVK